MDRFPRFVRPPVSLLRGLVLAIVIAAAPLLGWSAHNQRVYGFFGLSDYGGAVLYDGWVYFGENSHISIKDRASPAVRVIDAALEAREVAPPALPPAGPSTPRCSMGDIRARRRSPCCKMQPWIPFAKTLHALGNCYSSRCGMGLSPARTSRPHSPCPEKASDVKTLNSGYFDAEPVLSPLLVQLQRRINVLVARSIRGQDTQPGSGWVS